MAVERGQVAEIGSTQNGKPWLKIGGKKYFAGRCDVSAVKVGQMIEFEWNEFGDPHPKYGRSRGLQGWGAVPNGSTNDHAPSPSSALDDQDRPFISNIVAHAIAAGLIKEPEQLEKWAVAAQGAMKTLKGEAPKPRQPASNALPQRLPTNYDDGPPPYEDGPPPEEPPRRTSTW